MSQLFVGFGRAAKIEGTRVALSYKSIYVDNL